MFDTRSMDCENIQAALSARADGEDPGMPDTVVAWHVRACPRCSLFAELVAGADIAVPTAAGGIDVSKRIVAMAGNIDRSGVWWGLQAALFLIAVAELVLAIPDLLGHPSGVVGDIHLARHLGAFQSAYAVGLIVVALRPAKARAYVPVTAALAAAMIGSTIADIVQGAAPAISEVQHSLEISGMLLVWLLATRRGWPGHARHETRAAPNRHRSAVGARPRLVVSDESSGDLARHTA